MVLFLSVTAHFVTHVRASMLPEAFRHAQLTGQRLGQ
jgi:hypothetical protein